MSFDFRVSQTSSTAMPSSTSDFRVWWLHTRNSSLLNGVTITVSGCFHLGLWVLLHFSVFLDWPSTVTSTYGLGPNQFFLFSFSFADSTMICSCAFIG